MIGNRNTSGVSACEEVEFGHRRAPTAVGYNLRPRPHSAFQAPIPPLAESTAAPLLTPVGHLSDLRAPGQHQPGVNEISLGVITHDDIRPTVTNKTNNTTSHQPEDPTLYTSVYRISCSLAFVVML